MTLELSFVYFDVKKNSKISQSFRSFEWSDLLDIIASIYANSTVSMMVLSKLTFCTDGALSPGPRFAFVPGFLGYIYDWSKSFSK